MFSLLLVSPVSLRSLEVVCNRNEGLQKANNRSSEDYPTAKIA